MSKSKMNHSRKTINKLSVKGWVSPDGTMIKYEDENKIEQEIDILECFKFFCGEEVDFNISTSTEEDL